MALLSKGALKQKLWFFLLTLNEREYYLQLHLTFNLYTVEWGSGVGVLYCTPNYYSTADLSVVPVSSSKAIFIPSLDFAASQVFKWPLDVFGIAVLVSSVAEKRLNTLL